MLLEKPDRERGFKKERMLRVLLNYPAGELSKYRLAKLADATEEWAIEYTNRLEQRGYLDGTTVRKPRALYEEWRETRVEPNQLSISLQQPMQLIQELQLDYALTTYQAENLIQGFLFASTTDFYVQPDQIRDWLQVVEEKGLLGGGNTRLRATDEHVFYNSQRRREHTLVSTPQLIVDLLDEGGPCAEAAEKLIATFHGSD